MALFPPKMRVHGIKITGGTALLVSVIEILLAALGIQSLPPEFVFFGIALCIGFAILAYFAPQTAGVLLSFTVQAVGCYLDSNTGNIITDYYMMKDVHSILMNRGFVTVFEEENIEKLEALDNLEEIYFASGVDKERVKEFAILMKDIKPDCKIYHNSEEVVITE